MEGFLLCCFIYLTFGTSSHAFKVCDECNTSDGTPNITEHTITTLLVNETQVRTKMPDQTPRVNQWNTSDGTSDMTEYTITALPVNETKVTTEMQDETPRVSRLICYNCIYVPEHLPHGCRDLVEHLELCEPNEFCVVERETFFMPNGKELVDIYRRNCTAVKTQGCKQGEHDFARSTQCSYTCNTDKCNAVNVFPYEERKTTQTTTTAETSQPTSSISRTLTITTPEETSQQTSVVLKTEETSHQATTTSGVALQRSSATSRICAILSSVILIVKNVF